MLKIVQPDGFVSKEDLDAIELNEEFYRDLAQLIHLACQEQRLTPMIEHNRAVVGKNADRLPPELCQYPNFVARMACSNIISGIVLVSRSENEKSYQRAEQFKPWARANILTIRAIGGYDLPDIGVGEDGNFLLRVVEPEMKDRYGNIPAICKMTPELQAAEDFLSSVEHTVDETLIESGTRKDYFCPRYRVVTIERPADVVLFRITHCP